MNSSAESSRENPPPPASRANLLTWLQLMRLPTVFTALSNILCGFLLTHRLNVQTLPQQKELWWLLGSTIGLYLGGMVLNDFFDARLDAVERPERPIPSGRISRAAAGIFGTSLMLFGVLAASFTGLPGLLIAGLIVPSVLAYNAFLKSTIVAPLGMGTCRFLNLMLGASAVPDVESLWHFIPVTAAASLGIYVAGVTLFARQEAVRSRAGSLISGVVILLCGIALDAWLIGKSGANESTISGGRIALLLLGLNLLLRAAAAIRKPVPRRIQKTVGLMLMGIIFLDAILVFALTGDPKLGLLIVILVVPATLIRQVIPMS